MGSKPQMSLTRRILYSVLVAAFLLGFLGGMVFQNSDYYQGRFNIKGPRTTVTTEVTGPGMVTEESVTGPGM